MSNNQQLIDKLAQLLADTYALYLKTQNYHWHVHGPHFKILHELFEEQYRMLADAVDEIAERILTLGGQAPASFKAFEALKTLSDGDSSLPSSKMIADLYDDHTKVIDDLNSTLKIAQDVGDEGTIALLSERLAQHEKTRWMIGASKSN